MLRLLSLYIVTNCALPLLDFGTNAIVTITIFNRLGETTFDSGIRLSDFDRSLRAERVSRASVGNVQLVTALSGQRSVRQEIAGTNPRFVAFFWRLWRQQNLTRNREKK